jgi:hypothetical protein
MLWSLGSAYALIVVFSVGAVGCESQVSPDRRDESSKRRGTVVKATQLNRELLARFEVPDKSTASDESPLRIEAELVRAEDRPPYMLRGYVLVPIKTPEQTSKDPLEAKEYVKMPFGQMDVVAPLGTKEPFLLFPYEDAEAVRKRLKPGDMVLVGIEALPLTADDEKGERLDVELKVRRVISW